MNPGDRETRKNKETRKLIFTIMVVIRELKIRKQGNYISHKNNYLL